MKVKNYFDTDDDRPGRRPLAGTSKKSGAKKSADKGMAARDARLSVQTESIKISVPARPDTAKAAASKSAQKTADQPKKTVPEKQDTIKAAAAGVRISAVPIGRENTAPRSEAARQPEAQSNVVSMEDRLSRKRAESAKAAEETQSETATAAADMPEDAAPEQAAVTAAEVDSVSDAKPARTAAGLSAATSLGAAAPAESLETAATVWRSPAGLSAAAFTPGFTAPEAARPAVRSEAGGENTGCTAGPDAKDDGGEDDWDMAVGAKGKRKKADKEKGNRNGGGTGGDNGGRRKLPVVWVVVIDVVIAALLLLAFSLYYIIIPRDLSGDEKELPRPTQTAVATPAPTESLAAEPVVTEEPEPTPIPDGTAWGMKFPDKFTDGEVLQDETSYKSGNISVSIEHKELNKVSYYVADVYIKDYQYFRTAFGNENTFGYIDRTKDILEYVGGIIGVNGDFCTKNEGVVVRNGVMQRDKMHDSDLLVLNYDGTMQTFSPEEFDLEKIEAEGVWQVWTFGPMLLKDGQPMTEFNTTSRIAAANPRTAVGYFEPGHYCFVVADGRSPQPTDGFTLAEMSQILYGMGCKVAYNMDGGKTSEMVFLGKTVNEPYEGGRQTSDILYIADDKGGY